MMPCDTDVVMCGNGGGAGAKGREGGSGYDFVFFFI